MLRAQYVLWVPKLRYNVLFVSMIEMKGFEVIFCNGKVKLGSRGSHSTRVIIGVREHGLYQLMGKHIYHEKK